MALLVTNRVTTLPISPINGLKTSSKLIFSIFILNQNGNFQLFLWMELLNQLIKITQFIYVTTKSTTTITFNVIHEVMVKVNQWIILLFQLHNHVYLVHLLQLLLQFDKYRIFLIFLWIQTIWYKIVAEPIQNTTNGHINSNISLNNYFYDSCCIPSTNITPEPTSISTVSNKYYEEIKNNKNELNVQQITLENIEDIDNIIDSQYDGNDELNDTMDTNDVEEEKYNDIIDHVHVLKTSTNIVTPTTSSKIIELKSPSVNQIRSHSIYKSKSPFTYNSNSILNNGKKSNNNVKKYTQIQTQRHIEATWIIFAKNVPISTFFRKQKGGKYLNPWIIGCATILIPLFVPSLSVNVHISALLRLTTVKILIYYFPFITK